MPFTGSHAAAVLPFLRTRLPASALVLGSMAPDVPFYLPFDLGVRTHTLAAIGTVDVLIGLLAWSLWHGLLAAPVLATAPIAVRERVAGRVRIGLRGRVTGARDGALLVLALAVGSATHVLWDAFTHRGRWGTEHLGVLADTWLGRPGHAWAQDLSGLLGALVLLGWLVRWWRRSPPRPAAAPTHRWAWPAVAGAGVGGAVLGAVGTTDPRSAAVLGAFAGGGAVVLAAVLLALSWHVRRER